MLVLGDGLLGNAFKPFAKVLAKSECDITARSDVEQALDKYQPKVLINCAGIVPKHPSGMMNMFQVNAYAPHLLEIECQRRGIKLVHISTNCVFGKDGPYSEYSETHPTDLYGMSKLLGEPKQDIKTLVIRTSLVGLPDPKGRGLLAWASRQSSLVGFDRVLWNGVTTKELVNQILLLTNQNKYGIVHVASNETLSKFELLELAKDIFKWDVTIGKESALIERPHVENKTLLAEQGLVTKSLRQQLKELT